MFLKLMTLSLSKLNWNDLNLLTLVSRLHREGMRRAEDRRGERSRASRAFPGTKLNSDRTNGDPITTLKPGQDDSVGTRYKKL